MAPGSRPGAVGLPSCADVKANGVTVALSTTGTLSPTYLGPANATTNFVFDVTGYFVK